VRKRRSTGASLPPSGGLDFKPRKITAASEARPSFGPFGADKPWQLVDRNGDSLVDAQGRVRRWEEAEDALAWMKAEGIGLIVPLS